MCANFTAQSIRWTSCYTDLLDMYNPISWKTDMQSVTLGHDIHFWIQALPPDFSSIITHGFHQIFHSYYYCIIIVLCIMDMRVLMKSSFSECCAQNDTTNLAIGWCKKIYKFIDSAERFIHFLYSYLCKILDLFSSRPHYESVLIYSSQSLKRDLWKYNAGFHSREKRGFKGF